MNPLITLLLLFAFNAHAAWPVLSGPGLYVSSYNVPVPLTNAEANTTRWLTFYRAVESVNDRHRATAAACTTQACRTQAMADYRGRIRYHASVYYKVANEETAVRAAIAADAQAKNPCVAPSTLVFTATTKPVCKFPEPTK